MGEESGNPSQGLPSLKREAGLRMGMASWEKGAGSR